MTDIMTEMTNERSVNERIIENIIEDLQKGTAKAMVASKDVVNEFLLAVQKVMPKAEKIHCGNRTYIIDFGNREMIKRVEDEIFREISHHTDMISVRENAIKEIRFFSK